MVDDETRSVPVVGHGGTVTIRRAPTLAALHAELGALGGQWRILGQSKEHVRDFWLARSDSWRGAQLGVATTSGNLLPGFASGPTQDRIWIVGYGTCLTAIRIPDLEPVREDDLGSVFFEFLTASPDGPLLAIMET